MNDYEKQRLENIAANRALLASLGISVPVAPVVPSAQRKSLAPASSSEAISTSSKKKARLSAPPAFDSAQTGGARRSSRHAGKDKIDYKKEIIQERWDSTVSTLTGGSGGGGRGRFVDDDDNELPDGRQRKAARLGNRTQNPKSYGHIPGVPIGTVFDSRMAASTAAVHGPTVAGIFGLEKGTEGAYSIALSGGWEDDVDEGDSFTYTGSGGTALKEKNLRVGPQIRDQAWDHGPNACLKRSVESRKPVRVLRGFKCPSLYAPLEGYRYDGLYQVVKAFTAPTCVKASAGLKVCRFVFKRLEGQPPLPVVSEEELEAKLGRLRKNSKGASKEKGKKAAKEGGEGNGDEEAGEEDDEEEEGKEGEVMPANVVDEEDEEGEEGEKRTPGDVLKEAKETARDRHTAGSVETEVQLNAASAAGIRTFPESAAFITIPVEA